SRTRRVEVHLVEVALVVSEVAPDAERLETHHTAPRPLRRSAPIVTRDLRGQTAVFRGAAAGANCCRPLGFSLHAIPTADRELASLHRAIVRAEVDVLLLAVCERQRCPGASRIAEEM